MLLSVVDVIKAVSDVRRGWWSYCVVVVVLVVDVGNRNRPVYSAVQCCTIHHSVVLGRSTCLYCCQPCSVTLYIPVCL